MEQMLISNAVDQAINRSSFDAIANRSVFVEEKYLECVDKPYVVGTLRHRVLDAGGMLVEKREDADVVIEARSGGIGTDNSESFVGIPSLALPGPMPIDIPEVRLWEKTSQFGTAKLALISYDAKSGQQLNGSGTSLARSDVSKWAVMGIGPESSGSVNRELNKIPGQGPIPTMIARQPNNRRTASRSSAGRRHR